MSGFCRARQSAADQDRSPRSSNTCRPTSLSPVDAYGLDIVGRPSCLPLSETPLVLQASSRPCLAPLATLGSPTRTIVPVWCVLLYHLGCRGQIKMNFSERQGLKT